MTRINLVPPEELYDQHLFAEFREIKMIAGSLQRSITARGVPDVLRKIPLDYTLNTGHVSFFYDKGLYLRKRYSALRQELTLRGVNFNRESRIDPANLMTREPWNNDWTPTPEALELVRARIAEKVAMKQDWYRRTPSTHTATWRT